MPLFWAMLFSIFALILLFISFAMRSESKSFNITLWTFVCLGCCSEFYGIFLRVLSAGRAPITNMYETVLWTGVIALIFGSVIAWKFKEKRFFAIGHLVNVFCLIMIQTSTRMLDSSINPLTPVLRDNFWLSTHVTFVTFSYGLLAFSWIIANWVLVCHMIFTVDRSQVVVWNRIIKITIQIGITFLAIGILFGALWADRSWGRFWGWDPKETWSLISLIIYLIITHGFQKKWFNDIYFTIVAAVGFLSILMTWFGVNLILRSGLHSYGFGRGGAVLFIVVVFVEMAIILGVLFKIKILKRVTYINS